MSDLRPSLSVGEEQFWQHCMIYHLEPVRDLIFAPPRKWRFDFAFPEQKLAVEIEGGTWSNGRHSRGKGFEADCVKYNMAAILGWRILRFTSGQVLRGEAIDTVRAALKARSTAQVLCIPDCSSNEGKAMTIEEKMKQVLAEHAGPTSPDFERLREFYEEKKREGLIRKQEYTLPPMDTVGRTSCQWNWNQPLDLAKK